MRTPLAWYKFTHKKLRSAASLAGVCFAIVLIFMQLGFYDSGFRSATMLHDQLDFDVVLLSPHYDFLKSPGSIPLRRLQQARALPGVQSAFPLYVGEQFWRNPDTGFRREVTVLGIDPMECPFRLEEVRRFAPALKEDDTGIWDTKSQRVYGQVRQGTVSELGRRQLKIIGAYSHGAGFAASASLVVNDRTYCRLYPGRSREKVSLGLVKIQSGVATDAAVQELRAALPDDVEVWPRARLEAYEQNYFMNIKPIGIMFTSGSLMAFAVGAVVLYQILSAEVADHLKEYATLQAIGYRMSFVNLLVVQQGCLFACLGFVCGVPIALGIFALARASVNLPMYMTWDRIVLVFLLTVAMCSCSGLLVLRQVSRADPADLF